MAPQPNLNLKPQVLPKSKFDHDSNQEIESVASSVHAPNKMNGSHNAPSQDSTSQKPTQRQDSLQENSSDPFGSFFPGFVKTCKGPVPSNTEQHCFVRCRRLVCRKLIFDYLLEGEKIIHECPECIDLQTAEDFASVQPYWTLKEEHARYSPQAYFLMWRDDKSRRIFPIAREGHQTRGRTPWRTSDRNRTRAPSSPRRRWRSTFHISTLDPPQPRGSSNYSERSNNESSSQGETEPFPDFVDVWTDWGEGDNDAGLQDAYMQHCIMHCGERICQMNRECIKNENGKIKECQCRHMLKESTAEPSGESKISTITNRDVEHARRLYETMDKEETITINLSTATALVEQAEDLGILDFKFHLLRSTSTHYIRASARANELFNMFPVYFHISLTLLPENARRVTVQELEANMQAFMRLEVFWWISRWFSPESVDAREKFLTAVRTVSRGQLDDWMQALFERMEDVVKEVVSLLVWWDHEQSTQ